MIAQDDLTGHSAAILLIFVIVSFFVIWPVRIPVFAPLQRIYLSFLHHTHIIDTKTHTTWSKTRLYFPLSLETAPVIGVLLLLATTTIDGSTIVLGVKGDDNVKPYDVLVLFISLAYIAIALDGTGALEAVAFWVTQKGGTSGRRLFFYLYAFFLATGMIVGNDPLILSGTPFLAYLTRYTKLEPTAWIFSEFMAANTASAVLVSSNPTNILIAGSFQLNYLTDFTKWTVLPSVAAGVCNYFVLFFMFRHKIPKVIVPLEGDPWSKLRDPKGAVFLSSLMVVTIAVLVGTSFVPGHVVEVWMVTAPAGVLALVYEVVCDLVDVEKQRGIVFYDEGGLDGAENVERRETRNGEEEGFGKEKQEMISMGGVRQEESVDDKNSDNNEKPNTNLTPITNHQPSPTNSDSTLPPSHSPLSPSTLSPLPQAISNPHSNPTTPTPPPPKSKSLLTLLKRLSTHLPRTTRTTTHLPLPLLPFALSQFILIRGLSQRGWITTIARGFLRATPTPTTSIFFYTFISAAFLCPFAGTNIGATILLVEVLRSDVFLSDPVVTQDGARVLWGAVYATAMGSNLGAFSYVFAASLAGLLWRGLLEGKGIHVGQGRFCLVNLGPLVVQCLIACAILVGEVYWFI